MQGTDADTIASNKHDTLPKIDEYEGELAFEPRKQILAMLLIKMDKNLCV
jgi:hypothetical protein